MNQKLPDISCLSLKQLVLTRLTTALGTDQRVGNAYIAEDKAIPVHRGKNCPQVLYISGVALQIAKSERIAAGEVAAILSSALGDEFCVRVVPPGWLHVEISNPILAAWLETVARGGLESPATVQAPADPLGGEWQAGEVFVAQYAHARCCSLLRMAHRDRTISLQDGLETPVWCEPNPIPWLDSDQKFRFHHRAEFALIGELVQVLDDLYCRARADVDWLQAAAQLGKAVETFWSACRIWGEVKENSLHLAQARLGLLIVSQAVLKLLLEEKLGIFTPLEL